MIYDAVYTNNIKVSAYWNLLQNESEAATLETRAEINNTKYFKYRHLPKKNEKTARARRKLVLIEISSRIEKREASTLHGGLFSGAPHNEQLNLLINRFMVIFISFNFSFSPPCACSALGCLGIPSRFRIGTEGAQS